MALLTRLSRLLTADFHAVLDRIEEPDVLLKQALREMEDELHAAESRLRGLRHERERVQTRLAALDGALVRLDAELDLCFASNEEDLARAVVKRKVETRAAAGTARQRVESLAKSIAEQEATVTGQRERIEALRQQAEAAAAERGEASGAGADPGAPAAVSVGAAELEIAFLQEKQRRARS
jgi:phage shock protein A